THSFHKDLTSPQSLFDGEVVEQEKQSLPGRLNLHPVSRFGFLQTDAFSTRQSFVLAHSLVS
uniref:hypothetical protein n=1 Tax=Negativibacillus massiliensis TaxID=1871035 RepID=UPI003AF61810